MNESEIAIFSSSRQVEGDITSAQHSFSMGGDVQHRDTGNNHLFLYGDLVLDSSHLLSTDGPDLDNRLWEPSFYRQLTGHFVLVVSNKTQARTRVIASRFGGMPAYIRTERDKVLIASRLERLCNDSASLDQTSLKEFLEFRRNSGAHSLVDGITQLPLATYCDIEGNSLGMPASYEDNWLRDNRIQASREARIEETAQTLTRVMRAALRPDARTAVFLSGGIDSSVLTALARPLVPHLVAISHESANYPNPELEIARQFARELGIEHRIIRIDPHQIQAAFSSVNRIIERPIRNQSAVIIYQILKAVAPDVDQVIYGEAADSLFGSNMVKAYRTRYGKRTKIRSLQKLLPFFDNLVALSGWGERLDALMEETCDSYFTNAQRIEYKMPATELIAANFGPLKTYRITSDCNGSDTEPDLVRDLRALRASNLRIEVASNLFETVLIGRALDIQVISPFIHPDVLRLASALDDNNYFGDDYVKPVLRGVGERFYTRELMYLKKRGFPTPYAQWMNAELKPLWERAKAHFHLGDQYQDDPEFKWTMTCFHVLFEYLSVDSQTIFPVTGGH